MNILDKVMNFAEKYDMLPNGSTVVCGLSGGADSVFLVLCMNELSERLGITVQALHVNHCIRGDESDRDEQFCRDFCEKLGIPFVAVSCNVPEYAEKYGISLEDAARRMRYDAFAVHSAGKLMATAHNSDDNLETAILNLTRGTALKGICGIPPVRGNIIRPLLMVSRKEIENYLDSCGFSYVTDSTNLSDDYTRNKIRHHVIPILSQLNTSVVKTSAFSLDALRSENDFIEQQADSAYNSCRDGNCLNGLKEYHTVIRRRCIARLLTENSVPYSYDRLESADKITVNGGKINVSGELYLVSDKNSIRLEKISPEEQKYVCTELIIGENRIFDGRILNAELIPEKNAGEKELVHKNSTIYYLDYDKIIGRAFVRSRRCGDRIKLYGNNFTSSVKKLINEKIPPEKRKTLHFIEDDVGTVFAEGMGIADRAAPDGKTQRLLKITVE